MHDGIQRYFHLRKGIHKPMWVSTRMEKDDVLDGIWEISKQPAIVAYSACNICKREYITKVTITGPAKMNIPYY